jgi:hypothetical protein
MIKQAFFLLVLLLAASACLAQGNAAAGLAGVGAGAALGASASQSSTTPSSAGGGGNAPIEIQIMAYSGMRKIADDIRKRLLANTEVCRPAEDGSGRLLHDAEGNAEFSCLPVLIQDQTSSNQIALYQALQGYFDHMESLHSELQKSFSLQLNPQTLSFATTPGAAKIVQLTVTNSGGQTFALENVRIAGPNEVNFSVGLTNGKPNDCPLELNPNDSCTISIRFTPPDAPPPANAPQTFSAWLYVPNPFVNSVQMVPLNAVVTATAPSQGGARNTQPNVIVISPGSAGSTSGSPSGSSSTASTPSLTYLGGITTALGAFKSNITYSPSSFQPTTQAFQNLLEADFKIHGIMSYSSTSPVNLQSATAELSQFFGKMLLMGGDISSWANQCKPPTNAPQGNSGAMPIPNPECNAIGTIENLSIAQQMLTGYTTLIQSASDGNGNPVIIDILRGKVLWDKLSSGFVSLQVAVSAAGGSTRSNNFFLLDLFYTPKPSYNSGLIATFELRDAQSVLLDAGSRSVLYDYVGYSKWKPSSFDPQDVKGAKCDPFCSEP